MLNTFIKNQGISKTIIHDNKKNYYNNINWDANYDGKIANITLNLDENGNKSHMDLKMDNVGIAELLNIPSVNTTIDKRLYNDFLHNLSLSSKTSPKVDEFEKIQKKINKISTSRSKKKKVRFIEPKYTHISSPSRDEEIVFPLKINNDEYKNSSMKPVLYRRPITHITHKINRKMKSTSKKSNTYYKKSHKRRTF